MTDMLQQKSSLSTLCTAKLEKNHNENQGFSSIHGDMIQLAKNAWTSFTHDDRPTSFFHVTSYWITSLANQSCHFAQ